MTLSVRIPDRVEQEFADCCAKPRVTKSVAVSHSAGAARFTREGVVSEQTPYAVDV